MRIVMITFWIKVFISALVVGGASHLALKRSSLAGFIVVLPITSLLALLLLYFESKDMSRLSHFSTSILIAAPLSLTFYLPFVFHRWLKLNFYGAFILGLICVGLSYSAAYLIYKNFPNFPGR